MKPKTKPDALRVAFYARYSNEIQNDRSIERQFADLEKEAKRFGFILDKRHFYCDRAQTAKTLFDRPGLTRELLGAAERREFDVVFVEQTDRLSRNKADLFWLAEQFGFYEVKIFTPKGEVHDLQLLFEAHGNADFSEKLRKRVKSGHDELARQGLIPGKNAFGYDLVKDQPGVKIINSEQAKIIVRIFREYAAGVSPRAIATGLMRDGIPSPSGSEYWNFQIISGGEGRARGLLGNQLYIGRYLKNRFVNVFNPKTGKTITRRADPNDLITVEMPQLRIVDQALWDAVHKVRDERANKKFASGQVVRSTVQRKQHLLMGLLRCAECNTRMTITQSSRKGQRVVCAGAHNRQSCEHGKSYNLQKINAAVIKRMDELASDPEFRAERAKAKQAELERLRKSNNTVRDETQKRADRLDIQIKNLARMIDEMDDIPAEIMVSLQTKERERKGLVERLKYLGAENNVIAHPKRAALMADKLTTLATMLKKDPECPDARMAFGTLIEGVLIYRTGFGESYDLELIARDEAADANLEPVSRSVEEMLNSQGVKRVCFSPAHGTKPASSIPPQGSLISLGRWRAAA